MAVSLLNAQEVIIMLAKQAIQPSCALPLALGWLCSDCLFQGLGFTLRRAHDLHKCRPSLNLSDYKNIQLMADQTELSMSNFK